MKRQYRSVEEFALPICKKHENIRPQQTLFAKPKQSKTTVLEPGPKMKKSKGDKTNSDLERLIITQVQASTLV